MSIEKTIEEGDLTVEIDDWGGVHFYHDGEGTLSLSPSFMQRIERERKEVTEDAL